MSKRADEPISHTWWAKVCKSRENQESTPTSGELVALLWREGFGPVATARMLDWYCSAHPDTIAKENRQKEAAAKAVE